MERWQDSLENEELRTDPSLDRYKTMEDALASVPKAKAYQGSSVRIPPQDAPQEDLDKWDNELIAKVPNLVRMPSDLGSDEAKGFWKRLGVPEEKKDYINPEGIEGLDDGFIEQIQDAAVRANMTVPQFQAQLKYFSETNKQVQELNTNNQEAAASELKNLWGPAHDDNLALTDEMVTRHNEEHPDHKFGVLNNAARLFLLDQAKRLSSDPQIRNQVNTPSGKKSPAELREEYQNLLKTDLHKNPTKYSREAKEAERIKLLKYHELLAPYGGVG